MKGIIVECLGKLVVTQFGQDTWGKTLQDVGLSPYAVFWPTSDIDDAVVMELVAAACKNLDLSLAQLADAFGEYWINSHTRYAYPQYYAKHSTARDFLLDLDNIHVEMTRMLKDAQPPRFDFVWQDDDTLIVHYKSHRGLVDFVVGIAKGLGKYYKENLSVSKMGEDKVKVVFA
ncbi:MAG: hypothetical protein GY832_19280 [Chloroflexi bacterium]|nr:hypothetical protein [Chloroflexota bacterium]